VAGELLAANLERDIREKFVVEEAVPRSAGIGIAP
jgi:hypothetical protein